MTSPAIIARTIAEFASALALDASEHVGPAADIARTIAEFVSISLFIAALLVWAAIVELPV